MGDHRWPHDGGWRRVGYPARPNDRRLRGRGRPHQPLKPVLGDPVARHHRSPSSRHVRLCDHHDAVAHTVRSNRTLPSAILTTTLGGAKVRLARNKQREPKVETYF